MRSILGLISVLLIICGGITTSRLDDFKNSIKEFSIGNLFRKNDRCADDAKYQECSRDNDNMVVHAFSEYGIVPEIISCSPTEMLYIRGKMEAALGNFVPAFNLGFYPYTVFWPSDPHTMYTLIFFNADKNYVLYQTYELINLSMLVVNIPGDELTAGDVIMNYKPSLPYPGYGPQRYVTLVYEQLERIEPSLNLIMGVSTTDKFNLEEFSRKFNLGVPAFGNFFITSLSFCDDYKTSC